MHFYGDFAKENHEKEDFLKSKQWRTQTTNNEAQSNLLASLKIIFEKADKKVHISLKETWPKMYESNSEAAYQGWLGVRLSCGSKKKK